MSESKQKRQHTLPNRQLAQAFRFSASDLASNRHGFITRAQSWQIPLWMRGIVHQVGEWSAVKARFSHRRESAMMVCGRAVLHYEQQQIQSIFHADIIEVHKLSINNLAFRITPQQYQVLSDGVVYRLYYNPDTKRILSIERAVNGCVES